MQHILDKDVLYVDDAVVIRPSVNSEGFGKTRGIRAPPEVRIHNLVPVIEPIPRSPAQAGTRVVQEDVDLSGDSKAVMCQSGLFGSSQSREMYLPKGIQSLLFQANDFVVLADVGENGEDVGFPHNFSQPLARLNEARFVYIGEDKPKAHSG